MGRSQGGLGIGLCLVKNLVEMHGGKIEVRSEGTNKGNEFLVQLPVVLAPPPSPPMSEPGERTIPTSELRILVVDDNADAASSLTMLLRSRGNTTFLAHVGEEAVAMAGKVRPDVVLLDIGLPKMNGYDACRAASARSRAGTTWS